MEDTAEDIASVEPAMRAERAHCRKLRRLVREGQHLSNPVWIPIATLFVSGGEIWSRWDTRGLALSKMTWILEGADIEGFEIMGTTHDPVSHLIWYQIKWSGHTRLDLPSGVMR